VWPSDGNALRKQPEEQTTIGGSLAVSTGELEIAYVIQGALEVF